MKNKKGALVLVPFLVFLFVVGLIYAWSTITSSQQSFNEKIGEKQFQLINTYQDGENVLFYIDQSAKYSAYQSIYDLAQNGGYNEEKICGDYLGYSLWMTKDKTIGECKPDIKDNFKSSFNENLNQFFENYNKISNIIIPKNNYKNLILKEKLNIIGIAESYLVIPIGLTEEIIPTTAISFTPSNTDIDSYLTIIKSPLAGLGQCMIDAETRTTVPAPVILSVALHESGYGKSGLAQKSKNLFGIKCTKSYIESTCTFVDKTQCCKVWDKTALDFKYEPNAPNAYRVYQNYCESINNFADLISKSKVRYKIAMQYTSQPSIMVYKIREAGYATDPNWATGINKIMQTAQNEIGKIKDSALV